MARFLFRAACSGKLFLPGLDERHLLPSSAMSISDLKKALAKTRPRHMALVSDPLFWELCDALELTAQKHFWHAPDDPACKKIMDALLANQRLPKTDQIVELTWRLVHHDRLRVVRWSRA